MVLPKVQKRDLSLTEVRHPDEGYISICIVVPDEALANARLDGFDLALLRDCAGDDATISDKILALETVVRRWEEAHHGTTDADDAVG